MSRQVHSGRTRRDPNATKSKQGDVGGSGHTDYNWLEAHGNRFLRLHFPEAYASGIRYVVEVAE